MDEAILKTRVYIFSDQTLDMYLKETTHNKLGPPVGSLKNLFVIVFLCHTHTGAETLLFMEVVLIKVKKGL